MAGHGLAEGVSVSPEVLAGIQEKRDKTPLKRYYRPLEKRVDSSAEEVLGGGENAEGGRKRGGGGSSGRPSFGILGKIKFKV